MAGALWAGEDPQTLEAFPGKTPVLDGVISPGEWDDATTFTGVEGWRPQFLPVESAKDLSLRGYVKHDGKRLYFAFDVTDDVLYGIDTPRWLPRNNPKAHELTREGFPWFGDEIEVLINASNHWSGNEDSAGQRVVLADGLQPDEVAQGRHRRRRTAGGRAARDAQAWETYQGWILVGRAGVRRQGRSPAARATSSNGRSISIRAWRWSPGCSIRPPWATARWG